MRPPALPFAHACRPLPFDQHLFDLCVVHIDEREAFGLEDHAIADAFVRGVEQSVTEAPSTAIQGAPPPPADAAVGPPLFLVIPMEDVFLEDPQEDAAAAAATQRERAARLRALVASVSDPTGREDLIGYLRNRLLLRAAGSMGCNRVARGDSATRLAIRVVAEACKGRGYGLPGDIQPLDAREGPGEAAVVLPVREVAARDLALYCRLSGLGFSSSPAYLAHGDLSRNLNELCSVFVESLQRSHASAVPTVSPGLGRLAPHSTCARVIASFSLRLQILKTAAKLEAFAFNRGGEQAAIPLCPLCRAPLRPTPPAPGAMGFEGACCASCRLQVLGELQGLDRDEWLQSLPASTRRNATPTRLRAELEGFLLDGDPV